MAFGQTARRRKQRASAPRVAHTRQRRRAICRHGRGRRVLRRAPQPWPALKGSSTKPTPPATAEGAAHTDTAAGTHVGFCLLVRAALKKQLKDLETAVRCSFVQWRYTTHTKPLRAAASSEPQCLSSTRVATRLAGHAASVVTAAPFPYSLQLWHHHQAPCAPPQRRGTALQRKAAHPRPHPPGPSRGQLQPPLPCSPQKCRKRLPRWPAHQAGTPTHTGNDELAG